MWSNNPECPVACPWRVCCVCWETWLINSCEIVALCEDMCPSNIGVMLSVRGMLEYDGWLRFVESFCGTFSFLPHSHAASLSMSALFVDSSTFIRISIRVYSLRSAFSC